MAGGLFSVEGADDKKKTGTSPLYTYGSFQYGSTPAQRTAKTYYGSYDPQSNYQTYQYGSTPLQQTAMNYYSNYNPQIAMEDAQAAGSTPAPLNLAQLIDLAQRQASGREALLTTQADVRKGIRQSEQEAAMRQRQLGRAGTTARTDLGSVLAGAGMGRSPLAALTLERLAARTAAAQSQAAVQAEQQQQALRDRLTSARAAQAREQADLARIMAAYQTGNTDELLKALGV